MDRTSATPRTVRNDGVPVACLDHGGSGPDLVLMHGAGLTQASLLPLVRQLTGELRVVTFDFRGHGGTPMAPWTLDTAVSDLEAVVAAYRLDRPVVAGHSLGGMVAVEYARRHPECRAAINLDGHGVGTPGQYVGKDPAAVAAWQAATLRRAATLTNSAPLRMLVAAVRRLTGSTAADRQALTAILGFVHGLDLLASYRDVRVPLQVVNAYAPTSGLVGRLRSDPEGFTAAYRLGIRRDLTALSREVPTVELAELDATHMLIRTHPEQTARLMLEFLGRHAGCAKGSSP